MTRRDDVKRGVFQMRLEVLGHARIEIGVGLSPDEFDRYVKRLHLTETSGIPGDLLGAEPRETFWMLALNDLPAAGAAGCVLNVPRSRRRRSLAGRPARAAGHPEWFSLRQKSRAIGLENGPTEAIVPPGMTGEETMLEAIDPVRERKPNALG
jgi:hypothetical protein